MSRDLGARRRFGGANRHRQGTPMKGIIPRLVLVGGRGAGGRSKSWAHGAEPVCLIFSVY